METSLGEALTIVTSFCGKIVPVKAASFVTSKNPIPLSELILERPNVSIVWVWIPERNMGNYHRSLLGLEWKYIPAETKIYNKEGVDIAILKDEPLTWFNCFRGKGDRYTLEFSSETKDSISTCVTNTLRVACSHKCRVTIPHGISLSDAKEIHIWCPDYATSDRLITNLSKSPDPNVTIGITGNEFRWTTDIGGNTHTVTYIVSHEFDNPPSDTYMTFNYQDEPEPTKSQDDTEIKKCIKSIVLSARLRATLSNKETREDVEKIIISQAEHLSNLMISDRDN